MRVLPKILELMVAATAAGWWCDVAVDNVMGSQEFTAVHLRGIDQPSHTVWLRWLDGTFATGTQRRGTDKPTALAGATQTLRILRGEE